MPAVPIPTTRAELGKRSLNKITQDLVSYLVNAENPEKAIKNLNDFKKMKLIPEHIYNSIVDQASIENKDEVGSQQDISYLALELFMASLKEKENDIQDVNAPFADFMIEIIETLNLLIDDATNATPAVVMFALVFASAGVIKASVASSVLKAFFSHVFHTQDVSAVNSFLKTGLAFDNLIAKNVMGEKLQTLAQSHDYFNLLCAEFLAWKAITVPTEKLLVSNLMDHLGPIKESNPEMYSAYIALFATFYAAGAGLGTTAFVNFAAGLDSSLVYYMPAYQLIGLLDTEAQTALFSGTPGANALVLAFVSLKGALGFSLGLQSDEAKETNAKQSYNAFKKLVEGYRKNPTIDDNLLNAFNKLNQFKVKREDLESLFQDEELKDLVDVSRSPQDSNIDTTEPQPKPEPVIEQSVTSDNGKNFTSFLAQFPDPTSKKTPAAILKESKIDFEKDPKIIAFSILKSKLGIVSSSFLSNPIKDSYKYFGQLMDPSQFSGPDQTTDFPLTYNDVKGIFIESNIIKLDDEQLEGAIEFVKNYKMPKRIDELPLSIKIRVLLSKTLFPLFDLTLSVITPALLVLNVVTRFIFTLFTGCNVLTNEPIASIGSFLHKFSLNAELAKQEAIRDNVTNLLYFHEGDLKLLNQMQICDDSIETLKSDIKLNKQSSLFSLMSLSGIEKPPPRSEIISAIANSQIVEYFVSFPVGLANFSKGFVGLKTELLEQYTRDLITAEEKFYNDNNNNGVGLVINNEDSLDDILNKYRSENDEIKKSADYTKGLYDTNIRDAHKKNMPINLQTLNTLVFLPILLPLRLLTVTAILIRMAFVMPFVGFDSFSRYYLQSAKERTNDDVIGLLRALTIVVKFNLIFAPKWFMDRLTTPYRFAKRRAVAKGEIEKLDNSILVKEHLSSNLSLPAHKMLRIARKMEADIKDYYKIKYILVDKETGLPIKNNAEPRMNILTNTKYLLAACCTIENYVNVTINEPDELKQIITELSRSIHIIEKICSATQLHDTKRKLSGIRRVLKELEDLMPASGEKIPPSNIDRINEILAVSRTSLQGGRTLGQELNNLMSIAINEAYNVSYAHVSYAKGAQYLVANTSKYQYQEMLNELTNDSYRMKDIYDKRRFEKKHLPGENPNKTCEHLQDDGPETAEASAEKTSNTANLLNFVIMPFAIVGYTASIITNILKKIVVSVMGITPFEGKTIAKVDEMFSDMESNLNFKDLDATRFLETNYLDSIGNTSVSNRKRLGIDDSKEEFMQLIRHAKHENVTQEATGGQEDYYKKTQPIKHLTFTAAEISEITEGINSLQRNKPVEHPLLTLVKQHTGLARLCTREEDKNSKGDRPSSNL